MADNRLPNMAGQGGMQQSTAFNGMAGMRVGPMGQPMFGAMGQQQQQQFVMGTQFYPAQGMNPAMMGGMQGMAPGMYTMQSMHPARPPPPYSQQFGTGYGSKTRAPLAGAKGSMGGAPKPKTEKERYFEEQQKRLRQFHRPGAQVTDANTLVENLFSKTGKPGPGHGHGPGAGSNQQTGSHHAPASNATVDAATSDQLEDDDGFGDFLGGPTPTTAPPAAVAATVVQSVPASNAAASNHGQPSLVGSPSPEPPAGDQQPNPSVAAGAQVVEKKDLMSMMMQCSDLNAPQKAKGFHKPSLMEVQKTGFHHGSKTTEMHHESDHARRWDNTQELEGLFIMEKKAKAAPQAAGFPPHSPTAPAAVPPTHHPPHLEMMAHPPGAAPAPQQPAGVTAGLGLGRGVTEGGDGSGGLPDWCHDPGENLPVVYQHVLEAVSEGEGIVTERLYPILVMSGLPRELLGRLWSLANTQTPGQLTRTELWTLLAFIALVQNKYEVTSSAILKRCPHAPVPFLGQPAAQAAVNPAHSAPAPATPAPVMPGQTPPGPVLPGQVIPGAAPPGQVMPGPVLPAQATPGPILPGQAAPGPVLPGQVIPGPVLPRQATPGPVPPGQATPGPVPPGQATPSPVLPGQAVPGPVLPGQAVPGPVPPGHATPGPVLTGQVIPGPILPGQATPGPVLPAQSIPGPVLPGQTTPGPVLPGQATPGPVLPDVPPSQPFAPHLHPPPPSSTATPPTAVLPTSGTDDDFADFQAAPAPAVKAPQIPAPVTVNSQQTVNSTVTQTVDSYGEFIGGNSLSTSEQSLSSVPKEAADKLERLYSNGAMTADEQYNSNVRNFFCSSDSSTAKASPTRKKTRHTTPNSMDDEDFSDGRDSMSQVSTSEQSENEDIRAFENYVEEFNRKKEARSSDNPLAVTPHGGKAASVPMSGNRKTAASSAVVKTPPALNVPIPKPPGPVTAIPSLPPVNQMSTAPAPAVRQVGGDDDDFADFKSAAEIAATVNASIEGKQVKKLESSGDSNLMGEEDKYGALRGLSGNVSLFKENGEESGPKSSGIGDVQDEETEEWADFSAAVDSMPDPAQPSVAELSVSGTQNFPSSLPAGAFSAVDASEDGGEDWAGFAVAGATLAVERSAQGPSSGGPSAVAGPFSAVPAGDSSRLGFSSAPPAAEHPTTVHNNLASSSGQYSGLGVAPPVTDKAEVEDDDWADFASAKPSGGGFTSASDNMSGNSNFHVSNSDSVCVVGNKEGGRGGLFSAAGVATSSEVFTEVFTGADQSAVLTVKKQNLGTSEIMSVFKVRDDPTTLSSYELPKHPVEHHAPSRRHHQDSSYRSRRSRSGSKEHQMSPDGDDDFGMGPPPLDSVGDDEDEQEFSRGYDLDDVVHQPVPAMVYSPFGFGHLQAPGYSRSAFTAVTKTSKGLDRPSPATDSRSHSLSPESGETDSLSNRAPSLREDSQSVSSLDLPTSKISSMEAHQDSDNCGTDSQSVSSMEFGTVEGGARLEGGVSASKSLDSLDLRTGEGEEEGEDGSKWSRQSRQAPPNMMGQAPILGDRYNLDGQVEGSERYTYEWERCLASSCRHINNANNLFNTISSSSVCNEVLKSPQGYDYVFGLIEIYRVVCRIMTALSTTAVTSPSIEQSLKQIDLAWNNLTAFLVGASLLPEETTLTFTHAVLKSDSAAAQLKACGVCLLDVDCSPVNGSEAPAKLSYSGRQYHAPCANFWVNCVDSMLPALKLPELL